MMGAMVLNWMKAARPLATTVLVLGLAVPGSALAQAPAPQGRGGAPAGAPQTAQASAPIDLTGKWVAVISEDWRHRMITPAKGDYASVPLTPAGLKAADTWDPARDEAAGEQCRSYGAPGLMRGPIRLRISWIDPGTLRAETDYGIQTRVFRFGQRTPSVGPPTWQGESAAQWETPRGRGGEGAPRTGNLKVVTTRLRAGYLRKNGVPYSANTALTEYWDLTKMPNGDQWIVLTSVVHDPVNLQMPFTTALHFKKEASGAKWDPTPCSARW
jgi:hypothetical protein